MNERIKELLVKAIKEVGPDDDDSGAKEKTLEKFAELIVRECVDLIDTLNEAYDAPSTAGKFIKEHFGIE
jgi:hypothetical protein